MFNNTNGLQYGRFSKTTYWSYFHIRVQFHEQNVLFQILDHSAIMYQKSVSLELLVLKLVFFFFQLLFYFTFLFFHSIFSVSTCYKINWMEYPNEWAHFRFVVQQVLLSGNTVVLTKITKHFHNSLWKSHGR